MKILPISLATLLAVSTSFAGSTKDLRTVVDECEELGKREGIVEETALQSFVLSCVVDIIDINLPTNCDDEEENSSPILMPE